MSNLHDLILYATPTGGLARGIERFFDWANRFGPTAAQDYPPHISLTGFFHRTQQRREDVLSQYRQWLTGLELEPNGPIVIEGLYSQADWLGITVSSDWLETVTADFAQHQDVEVGEDELRLKTGLHISLAYGVKDLEEYFDKAETFIDMTADVNFDIALWERIAIPPTDKHSAVIAPTDADSTCVAGVGGVRDGAAEAEFVQTPSSHWIRYR